MKQEVCAVVVTFNRKALLQECLGAILAQNARVGAVLVIDNASTDGTAELVATEFTRDERIEYVRLPRNLGGAGGFCHGIQLAHRQGWEWLWLMDDDTIPSAGALAALFAGYERFPPEKKPRLLASKVQWTDETLHPMNLPEIKRANVDPPGAFLAAENSALSLRWASFVSILVERRVVDEFGLPFADYFIWNDDTEYTARVLRRNFGVLIPQSVVIHKTARKHSPMDAAPERAYYQARNVLWMILRSDAWNGQDRLKIGLLHLSWIFNYLRLARFRSPALAAMGRGFRDGLFRQPAG